MNNKQYLALAVTLSLTGYSLDEYTAEAAIPDEEGIFTGCVSKFGGLRLIDTDNMRCSRFEKKVTWSQGQNVPVSGPFIVDVKGQFVGNLLDSYRVLVQGVITVLAAGMSVNGNYYWIGVSEEGFPDSYYSPFPDKDGRMCQDKYYHSNDCTGDFLLSYSGSIADPNKKYFSNFRDNSDYFIYERKLYEYDASKVVWGALGREFKSSINECLDPNSWPPPSCRSYDEGTFPNSAFIPPDGYYEVADLTNFEPPFKLVVD